MKINMKYTKYCLAFAAGLCACLVTTNVQAQGMLADSPEVMEVDTLNQVETVRHAYGQIDRNLSTNAIHTITGEELLATRATNFIMALQGRLPGLTILQRDGEPGKESFSVQLRGFDTQNSSEVLFFVDGIQRVPNYIDLQEIDRVTVLKDGAATAIYGMRGSGGVILVDTKRGYIGESKVSIAIDQAFQTPTYLPKFASAGDYAKYYNQRVANDTIYEDAQSIAAGGSGINHSNTDFYSAEEIAHYVAGDMLSQFPVRDMVDDFIKDFSAMTRFNINFQGGKEKMRYFTSLGYLNQGGLFEQEPFDAYSYDSESKTRRFNFRTNLDITLSENTNAWVQVGGSLERNNAPFIGSNQSWDFVLAKLYETPNNAHNDLTPDGEVLVKRDRLNFRTNSSVYGYLNRTGVLQEDRTRLGTTIGLRRDLSDLVKGLSASGQVAFDVNSFSGLTRSRTYEAFELAMVADQNLLDSMAYIPVPGTENTGLADNVNYFFRYEFTFQGRVEYNRTFGNHRIAGLLLAENWRAQSQILLPTNYATLGGRINYAFDNKYLVEGSFSYQGNEQFAPGSQYGFFPGLSLGWLASNESFLQGVSAINYFKVRASVAQVGNNAFGYGGANQYLYQTTWNANNSTENTLGNPSYTWEKFTKYNAGFDAQLLENFMLGFDFFYHDNSDIVIAQPDEIPSGFLGTGASLPPLNTGVMTNQGMELTLGYNKLFTNGLYLGVDGHVSTARNEVIDFGELSFDDTYFTPFRTEGFARGTHFGYKTDGLFQDQTEIDNWADQSALGGVPTPGDIRYIDLNEDGIIDERDRTNIGNPEVPQTIFGLNLSATFKGFDLSMFWTGMFNRDVYLQGFGRWSNRDNLTRYMIDNAWSADNPGGEFPRLGNLGTNFIKSDFWMENGSVVRLKNIELGYTVPEKYSSLIGFKSVRAFVNAQNLLTLHSLPNDDFDPEVTNGTNISYPLIRAFIGGITLKF